GGGEGVVGRRGGPGTPAAGWALGVERIALALGEEGDAGETDVFVVAEDGDRERALALVTEMRRSGLAADLDLAGRAIKSQMKQADRVAARYALILGADAGKATLPDMSSAHDPQPD